MDFLQTLSNIRSIRYMALEDVFRTRFDKAAERAHSMGVRARLLKGARKV